MSDEQEAWLSQPAGAGLGEPAIAVEDDHRELADSGERLTGAIDDRAEPEDRAGPDDPAGPDDTAEFEHSARPGGPASSDPDDALAPSGLAATAEEDIRRLDAIEADLAGIDAALRRLDAGTYGTCEVCGTDLNGGRAPDAPDAATADAATADAATADAATADAADTVDVLATRCPAHVG